MTTRDLSPEDRDGWLATSEEVQRWRKINERSQQPPSEYFDPHWKFQRNGWFVIWLVYAAVAVAGYYWIFKGH